METHRVHPLTAIGLAFSTMGAAIVQYLPTLFGFALTLVGLWLQHRENRRHEAAMAAAVRPGRPIRIDPPEPLDKR